MRPLGDASDPLLDPIRGSTHSAFIESVEIFQLNGAKLQISVQMFDPTVVRFGELNDWKESNALHPYAISDTHCARKQIKEFVDRNVWAYVDENVSESDMITCKVFLEARTYVQAKKVCTSTKSYHASLTFLAV